MVEGEGEVGIGICRGSRLVEWMGRNKQSGRRGRERWAHLSGGIPELVLLALLLRESQAEQRKGWLYIR